MLLDGEGAYTTSRDVLGILVAAQTSRFEDTSLMDLSLSQNNGRNAHQQVDVRSLSFHPHSSELTPPLLAARPLPQFVLSLRTLASCR